jgi:hypothetical protein
MHEKEESAEEKLERKNYCKKTEDSLLNGMYIKGGGAGGVYIFLKGL